MKNTRSRIKPGRGSSRPFTCDQNGVTYQTLSEAAEDLGLPNFTAHISDVLHGMRKSAWGYTFHWEVDDENVLFDDIDHNSLFDGIDHHVLFEEA